MILSNAPGIDEDYCSHSEHAWESDLDYDFDLY
jgi:hypothetical protein